MRFFEISSGLRVPVSGEEQHLVDRAAENRTVRAKDLGERDGEVARQMVNRALFNRHEDADGEYYTVNDCADLWRF